MSACTRDEWMTIAAARLLHDRDVCFVGIGLPSAACNLARLTHAPAIVLIYESGTIGTRPDVLPLSIGDSELAETAACVVPLPEIFSYYLQAGRIDVGFLGAAQIDRHGNLNSTVIGPYDAPTTRLPGAGGAPEIALHAKQVFVMLRASRRSFVERLDFCSSAGYLDGHGARARSGATGGGPRAVITDFGMLTPHPQSEELQLAALFADASVEEARDAIGWPLRVADRLDTIAAPSAHELDTLRALNARTREAHARPVHIPLQTEGLP
ncbi:CoA-transferase subunit beta [Rhodanobacter ginsengisoli]|uniref:CoA-transferase subunit beta n=1 Tax=Rhodanobacter ginsengisoli TaxID=418646 RepID=A0ABW0QHS5_9GAMM